MSLPWRGRSGAREEPHRPVAASIEAFPSSNWLRVRSRSTRILLPDREEGRLASVLLDYGDAGRGERVEVALDGVLGHLEPLRERPESDGLGRRREQAPERQPASEGVHGDLRSRWASARRA